MSAPRLSGCPDWPALVAHRYSSPPLFGGLPGGLPFGEMTEVTEPSEWDEAVAHLESCPNCRGEAFAADPSLLFVAMPGPRIDDAEVVAMKAAVKNLVAASKVTQRESAQRAGGARRLPTRINSALRRGLAAASLVAASLLAVPRLVDAPPSLLTTPAPSAASVTNLSATTPAAYDLAYVSSSEPLFEDLGRSSATIYQVESEDLSVVMIVDSSLDV